MIQRVIEDPLSESLLMGEFADGARIYADLDAEGKACFSLERAELPAAGVTG